MSSKSKALKVTSDNIRDFFPPFSDEAPIKATNGLARSADALDGVRVQKFAMQIPRQHRPRESSLATEIFGHDVNPLDPIDLYAPPEKSGKRKKKSRKTADK